MSFTSSQIGPVVFLYASGTIVSNEINLIVLETIGMIFGMALGSVACIAGMCLHCVFSHLDSVWQITCHDSP